MIVTPLNLWLPFLLVTVVALIIMAVLIVVIRQAAEHTRQNSWAVGKDINDKLATRRLLVDASLTALRADLETINRRIAALEAERKSEA